jgi:hypothetical protein
MKLNITVSDMSWLTENGNLVIQILWLLTPVLAICAVLYALHVLAQQNKRGKR